MAVDAAVNDPQIECRTMTGTERLDAFALYRAQSDDETLLAAALGIFLEREDLGMIWMAYVGGRALGACSVSYEIGLPEGAVVARASHLAVEPGLERAAVATVLL